MSIKDVRSGSCTSLLLLDSELDNNSDVFDPPAWRPGRFLQFADICLQDEPSVRPVSLSTGRASFFSSSQDSDSDRLASASCPPCGVGLPGQVGEERAFSRAQWAPLSRVWSSTSSESSSFVVELDAGLLSQRHRRLTQRSLLAVTSCVVVALTALTFLTSAM